MFKKIGLILETLHYVKPIQIYFQVWYRIKNKFLQLSWYKKYDQHVLESMPVSLYKQLILSRSKYLGEGKFSFLQLSRTYSLSQINWNDQHHGKLWNYNLQYFDYLHDTTVPLNERLYLIEQFSGELLSGNIHPEPYPVSLRIINTIYFLNENNIKNNLVELALKRQIAYLEKNLEYHLLANHLLENIFTLFISSYALNDMALFQKAQRLLLEQLEEQILSDGAHYECSPMYHSIILSKLLMCIEATDTRKNFIPKTDQLKIYASKMLSWLQAFSFPDGTWALVNDSALNIAPDTKTLLDVGLTLGINVNSIELNESGYRKIRGKNWEALIDVGKIIPVYQPGHAHSDLFHFCIWYNNKQVIGDTGISTYNNHPQRWYERSTLSHNTVCVANENQSNVWSAFRVGKRAYPIIEIDSKDCIKAYHYAYRKKYGIIHTRTFNKIGETLIIEDTLTSREKIPASTTLIHFGLGIGISALADNSFSIADGCNLVCSRKPSLTEALASSVYNQLQSIQKLTFETGTSSHIKIHFS